MDDQQLKNILEAILMSAGKPLSVDQLSKLFDDDARPSVTQIRKQLDTLVQDCEGRGIELVEVASGFRYQGREDYGPWVSKLWEVKPQRYSRALLETLALIAYRQPVTRADIEEVRGVSVSTSIMKTLMEREWVQVIGHRDVPGRPAMYATTRLFLDYFNLKSLNELPTLSEMKDLSKLDPELDLSDANSESAASEHSDAGKNASSVSDNTADNLESESDSSSRESIQATPDNESIH